MDNRLPRRFVVALTGASGAIYGLRLVQALLEAGHVVDLSISPAARDVLAQELGIQIDLEAFDGQVLEPWLGPAACPRNLWRPSDEASNPQRTSGSEALLAEKTDRPTGSLLSRLFYWHYQDWSSPLASGSAVREAMIICPCSLATVAAVVHGLADNVIRRAAEVHLKERRPVIVVPRETPLSVVQLRNLYRAARLGITVLPAMPGFYHRPQTVGDLVDFVVARICDHLGVDFSRRVQWPTSS